MLACRCSGAKQNHARKLRVAIDQIDFEFEVMDGIQPDAAAPASSSSDAPSAVGPSARAAYSSVRPPASGIYCSGLFLEGARWDEVGHVLAESKPKVCALALLASHLLLLFCGWHTGYSSCEPACMAARCLTRVCVCLMSQVLYTPMPVIWMQPVDVSTFQDYPHYDCPLYKTAERRGVLSTTGHSTNFVVDIRLPTGSVPSEHWIKRGVALLTSLSA